MYSIAKFSDIPPNSWQRARNVSLWGNELGVTLRQFMRRSGRPLVWADDESSAMLLDPLTAQGCLQGINITQADLDLFDHSWAKKPTTVSFAAPRLYHRAAPRPRKLGAV